MQRKVTFAETVESLLSYARWFGEVHGLELVNAHKTDVVEDKISSEFMAIISRATYIHRTGARRMKIRYQCIVRTFRKLGKHGSGVNNLRITHLDEPKLYISSEINICTTMYFNF